MTPNALLVSFLFPISLISVNSFRTILAVLQGEKHSILYVDDDADNLLAFRSVFRRFLKVYTANGGDEAIEILKEKPIHLLLSDQRMPKMTGVELCSNVMESHPDTVRIIVTGYSEMQPIMDAMNDGKVARYIMKPWNVEELKGILSRELGAVG